MTTIFLFLLLFFLVELVIVLVNLALRLLVTMFVIYDQVQKMKRGEPNLNRIAATRAQRLL